MDPLVTLFTAPWAQPLVGLLVTALGSWLGSRRSPGGSGISQTATTHGHFSPVTQTVNQNTWHVTPPAPRDPPPSGGATRVDATSDADENARLVGLGVAVLVGVAALTWFVAANWTAVALTLRIGTLVALFVSALTWRRWPEGVRGAWGLRVTITALATAVLWVLSTLPVAVRDEPTLAAIERATRGLSPLDSVLATGLDLGLHGILAYELRLGGLVLLLLSLYQTTTRGLGAVIAESAARRTPPNLTLVTLGNRLIGPATMSPGYFAGLALLAVIAVALVHPVSVGWLLDLIDQVPDRLPGT